MNLSSLSIDESNNLQSKENFSPEPSINTEAVPCSLSWDQFRTRFDKLLTPEEKLRSALTLMKELLNDKENLPFKEFWEARKLCLPLFKQEIMPKLRSELWEEYVAVTREGRELKTILHEEAAFAAEQIEIAIKAIEEEVKSYALFSMDNVHPQSAFPPECNALGGKYSFYIEKQSRLNLLNVYAQRIHSLRKELIKTPMRFRFKNQFFQRLSELGDRIFPPRRELIQELSDTFVKDVSTFTETYFSSETFAYEKIKRQVFFFREEIKALQGIAKFLTLNTQAFTTTREELSKCWDLLKGMEKEIKKEYAQQKHKSLENAALIREEIEKIKKEKEEKLLDDETALVRFEDVLRKMRGVELTRKDVVDLKEEVRVAKEPLFAKKEEEGRLKKEKELAALEKRRQELEEFKTRVAHLQEEVEKSSVESITKEIDTLSKMMHTLAITKKEKTQLERIIKKVQDRLTERREESLLTLSEDERKNYENLLEILAQRKERRLEIKKQLEEYRKIVGGSSLDFSKAMEYNELLSQEKERLEKIEEGIAEIETKIRAIKTQG